MQPLLEIISPELFEKLKQTGRKKTFSKGKELFAEGAAADFLPVILSGKVKMVRFLEAGKEVIIDIFEDGEMFAVPPVFDGGPYPAAAVAMEKTELLLLYREDFLHLLRQSDEFAFAVIGWMCGMLREKTAVIKNLATASPAHRIGNILLRLAEKERYGEETRVKISLRRQDIAEMAGLTTETTIRAVRRLAEKNLVRISHGKIILERAEDLQRFLDS